MQQPPAIVTVCCVLLGVMVVLLGVLDVLLGMVVVLLGAAAITHGACVMTARGARLLIALLRVAAATCHGSGTINEVVLSGTGRQIGISCIPKSFYNPELNQEQSLNSQLTQAPALFLKLSYLPGGVLSGGDGAQFYWQSPIYTYSSDPVLSMTVSHELVCRLDCSD